VRRRVARLQLQCWGRAGRSRAGRSPRRSRAVVAEGRGKGKVKGGPLLTKSGRLREGRDLRGTADVHAAELAKDAKRKEELEAQARVTQCVHGCMCSLSLFLSARSLCALSLFVCARGVGCCGSRKGCQAQGGAGGAGATVGRLGGRVCENGACV
jgi:hypothetical protein